uniref:Uncharacterized protein n=1 Tax=Kalanchoe fedtschenkoi TaxID=63787 RepID=A0A7N0V0K7_KALFE
MSSSRRGLHLISSAGSPTSIDPNNAKIGDDGNKLPSIPPSPSRSIFRRLGAWILGFFASVVLPFWNTKWDKIKRIEGEAEVVVEEMEKVARVVEKVAVVAEKVSEELAEALPENSKVQKTAVVIENLSKIAAADANSAENIIHKVEVLKKDFEDLEKAVRPVMSTSQSNEHGK